MEETKYGHISWHDGMVRKYHTAPASATRVEMLERLLEVLDAKRHRQVLRQLGQQDRHRGLHQPGPTRERQPHTCTGRRSHVTNGCAGVMNQNDC